MENAFCRRGHYFDGVQNCSLSELAWTPRGVDTYVHELSTHLKSVDLRGDVHRDQFVVVLSYRRGDLWGRRVDTNAVGEPFRLLRNDSLVCPAGPLFFLKDLDTVMTPCRVYFFRPKVLSGISKTTLLWNTSPLHSFGINFCGPHILVEDEMHNGSLGYEGRYAGEVLMRALMADVFGTGCRLQDDRLEEGVLRLRARMEMYYDAKSVLEPCKDICRIKRIAVNMLGDPERPCLHAHAGETKSLLDFCVDPKVEFPDVCGFRLLHESGRALLQYNAICKNEPRKMSHGVLQQLWDACLKHLRLYELAGGHVVPKHHAMVHQTLEAFYFGNPAFAATWQDEHENGIVKSAGVTAHIATFAKTIFQKIIALELNDLSDEAQLN